MKELMRKTSQNGRWGLSVVGPEGTTFPAEGRLVSLGDIEGHQTFEFCPAETGQWVVVGGDLEPIQGCTAVAEVGLQGGSCVSVLVCGEFAAYRRYGYKRRGQDVVCLHRGQAVDVPASVLAAMGILPCYREEVVVENPALSGALAAALKAAGIE